MVLPNKAQTGYALTSNSAIQKTEDGGEVWSLMANIPVAEENATFHTEGAVYHVVIVGANGLLLKYEGD